MGKTTGYDLIAKDSRREAKRAVRAHHKHRMRKHAKKVFYSMSDEWVRKMADNLKTCSCPWCCGNPRVLYGDSLQEIRAKARFNLRDWD